MRISKRNLEARLITIHRDGKKKYELNYASCYGGWQLTANNGSTVICHRVPAKEMLSFLDGIILGININKFH
jgi:hypothetical protein